MDCCDNICGGGSACDPLDGISMREVMECLRGVSHDELINQLESIGFRFNEQDMIRQLNKFDAVSKRRIVKQAGVIPGKSEIVDGLRELSPNEANQVLIEAKFHEGQVSETIVEAGFRKLRPQKAKLIVTDCGFDKDILVTALHERSHEELSSLFKAAKVPFIVASETEIANTLRGFTPCQQKATLVMAGLDKSSVDDVIETIHTLDSAQQAKVGRECELEPTDEQLVRILTRFNDNRLSKLMRECAFVPRNDDCVQMLSNLEPGSRNAVLSRVNWEAPLAWLVSQVDKLNKAEMERVAEIISTRVCMPEEAVVNTLRQSTPEAVGQMLRQCGIQLPVPDISKNLKRLLPDEASHAIQRARVEKLSLESVTAGLKLMRPDVVKRAIKDSGHTIVDDEETVGYLQSIGEVQQTALVKAAGVKMISPVEEEIEPVIKAWTTAQQASLLRRLGWHHNVEFMVAALKNMEYSKQLQVLEDANIKPKMTVELTQEYLMTLQPKVLEDLISSIKYLPTRAQIIQSMEDMDHTSQRLIVKAIEYMPPQMDVVEALTKMTPTVAKETVEIAEVNPRPSPELIANELMNYPEKKSQKLIDSIDLLPSDEATTKKMRNLSFDDQRMIFTSGGLNVPVAREDVIRYFDHESDTEVQTLFKALGPRVLNDEIVSEYLKKLSKNELSHVMIMASLEVIVKDEEHVKEYLLSLDIIKQKQMVANLECFTQYDEVVKLVRSINPEHKQTLVRDCELPVKPSVDDMVTYYFDLSVMRRKEFIKEIGYLPTVSELAEILQQYDLNSVAQAILTAGIMLPRSVFGPLRSSDEVAKTLEDTNRDVLNHGLRILEFKPDLQMTAFALKEMSQEQFHEAIKSSGKCICIGTDDLKCGMSHLGVCDAASVASCVTPGGGQDTQMSTVLMKRMTHCDQMKVITQAGVAALEASDPAVGEYLKSLQRERLEHILKSNNIELYSFESVLDYVRNMENSTFSRLIKESGLTPDLDQETLVRCLRGLGETVSHKIFKQFGYVPPREEVVRILKEIEPHMRNDVIMESDFQPSCRQITELALKTSVDERRQIIDMLSHDLTDSDIINIIKKFSKESIIMALKETGFVPDMENMSKGLKQLCHEHQNTVITEGAGDVSKFVEENELVEALRRLRPDQVTRAIKTAGLESECITQEGLADFAGKLNSKELSEFLLGAGVGDQVLVDLLRQVTPEKLMCVLRNAGLFPLDVEIMSKSFQLYVEASQAQFFAEICVANPSVFNGFTKYPVAFKRCLMMSIDYLPEPEDLITFLKQHSQESKRTIISAIDYQSEAADIVYAFRSMNPKDVSGMLHTAGLEIFPLEEDCIRTFKEHGNEFANRVMHESCCLPDKCSLEKGLLALGPMEQQQVVACVGIKPPLCEPLLLETLKLLRPDECKRALKQAGFSFDSEEELTELMMKKTRTQQEEILKKAGANFVPLTEKGVSEGLATFTQDKLRQVMSMINKYPPPFAESLAGFKALTIDKQRQFLAESGSRALPTDEQMMEGFQAIRTKGDFLLKVGYIPSKTEFVELLGSTDQQTRREIITTIQAPLTPGDVSKFLKELIPQDAETAILASGVIPLPSEEMLLKAMNRQSENVIRRIYKDLGYVPDSEDVIKGLQSSNSLEIERIFRLANIKRPVDEDVIAEGLRTLRPDESQRAIKIADIGNPTERDIIAALKSMSDYEQLQIVKSSGLPFIPATEAAVADYLKNKLKAKQRQILKSIDFPGYLDLIEIIKEFDLCKQWQIIEDANIDYFQHVLQDAEKLQILLIEGLKHCASMQQGHVIKHSCDRLPTEIIQYYLSLLAPDERRKIFREIGPYPNEHSSLCELVSIVNSMSPKDRHNFLDMVLMEDLPNDIMKKTFKTKRPTEMQELICELEFMLEPYGPLCRKDPEKMRCCVIEFLKCCSDVGTKEILKMADKCLIVLLTVPPRDCVPVEPVTRLLNCMPHADAVEAISRAELQLKALIMRNLLCDVAVRKLINYPSIEELATEIIDLKSKDLEILMRRIMAEIPIEQFMPDDIMLRCLLSIPDPRRYQIVTASCPGQFLCPFEFPPPDMLSMLMGQLQTNIAFEVLLHCGNCELANLCTGLTVSKVLDFLRRLNNQELSRVHDEIWSKNGSPCSQVDSSAMMREAEAKLHALMTKDAEEFRICIGREFDERQKDVETHYESIICCFRVEVDQFVKSESCRLADKVVRNLIDGFFDLAVCATNGYMLNMSAAEAKQLKIKEICDEVIGGPTRQSLTIVTQGISDLIHEYFSKLKEMFCNKQAQFEAMGAATTPAAAAVRAGAASNIPAATPAAPAAAQAAAKNGGSKCCCGPIPCGPCRPPMGCCGGGGGGNHQLHAGINRLMGCMDQMATGCHNNRGRCGCKRRGRGY